MNSSRVLLPYNKTNPVIYDNDAHADVFTDELLLALSSAGEIDLRGFITSSPENGCVNRETYLFDAAGREAILQMARRSGLHNIPPHYMGPDKPLARPASGEIDDTVPCDTPGSRFIIEQAHAASPVKPLVIAMGGPLTVAVSSYLLDKSIAERIVIAWLGGTNHNMEDYNGGIDWWASYITLKRLRLVQFPFLCGAPDVSRERFGELPESALRQWLIEKRLPHVMDVQGGRHDHDGQPVISIIRPDYVLDAKRVSYDHFDIGENGRRLMPCYKDDPDGTTMVVTKADESIAKEAWWNAISDPRAWGKGPRALPAKRRPFYAAAFPIGEIERIEAEDFDRGGAGVAFHAEAASLTNSYREESVTIIAAQDSPGGYNQGAQGGFCLSGICAGDWYKYSLTVMADGDYAVAARVASDGPGGTINLEFDDEGAPLQFVIPDTGGELIWRSVEAGTRRMKKGPLTMTVKVAAVGAKGTAGNCNFFTFKSR